MHKLHYLYMHKIVSESKSEHDTPSQSAKSWNSNNSLATPAVEASTEMNPEQMSAFAKPMITEAQEMYTYFYVFYEQNFTILNTSF